MSEHQENIEIPRIFRLDVRGSEISRFKQATIDDSIEIVDDVRIRPSYIHFANAYEGKTFKEKLVIQNIGKNGSFVRMMPPTSNTFHVKYFKEGRRLSAGLKIVRTISYKHMTSIAIPQATLPIWINDTLFEIRMIVTLSTAVISVDPQIVDFGRIDADQTASVRTLTIYNTGHKGAQFSIDLGSNQLHLFIEPMKGIINAESSVCLKIELVGFTAGDFLQEFWIKTTQSPKRVIVKGTFIVPKIVTSSFFDSLSFSVVEFPRTYYGATSIKPLFIQNYSSSNSIFYIMAEIRGKIMTLEEAKQVDDNYKQFSLQSYDGRMHADQGSLVLITFTPKRLKNQKYEKHHFACFLRVIRMDWKDISQGIFKEEIEFSSDEKNIDEANTEETHSLDNEVKTIKETDDMMESSLKFAIYGDIETPKIQLRPNVFILENLEIGATYSRALFVENLSKYNSITIKYCKIVNIDIVPDQFKLNPQETSEITVKIHPVQIGKISKNLVLELLHPDMPNTSGVLRKIHQVSIRIEYDVKMSRKILGKPCPTHRDLGDYLQEPLKDYRLTPKEVELKNANKTHYCDYLKKICNKPQLESGDYDLTDKRLLLFENYKCKAVSLIRMHPKNVTNYFVPLSPKQLYSIRITPKFIDLKKLAPFTTITSMLLIENQNNFPIRVFLKTSKSCINFQDDQRTIIDKNHSKKIAFNFQSNTIGKHNATIQVVVNESHIFKIAIIANIKPKDIRLADKKIEFVENNSSYKLIRIFNDLNSNVSFEWDLCESQFNIYPKSGTIRAESFMYGAIYHTPNPIFAEKTECSVFSERKLKQIVQLSCKRNQPKINLIPDNLDCGLIPINTTIWRTITLINEKNQLVYYYLKNPTPIDGIEIQPQGGVINQKDELKLIIKLHFKSLNNFTTKLLIHLQDFEDLIVNISGIVDYPQITLKPDYLQFTNIAIQSYKHLLFKIQNLSTYPNRIQFKLDNYPEITITENEEVSEPTPKQIQLEANELKTLYCHFQPDKIDNYWLYLPIIINDSIELPSNNDQQTQPLLKINCSTIQQILQVSSLQTNFVYFAENHRYNKTRELIKFTNISEDLITVSLKLDDLDRVFQVVPVNLKNFDFQLDREEFAVFQINFVPELSGIYRDKVPIMLNNRFFNYLKLFGNFQLPDLIPERNAIYFEPIPLNLRIEQELILNVANHENCTISTKTDIASLTIDYKDNPFITRDSNNKTLILIIKSKEQSCIDSNLEIFCTCGSKSIVRIKAIIVNSLITTHHCYKQINKFYSGNYTEITYKNCGNLPRFPEDSDDSFYANHQREVLENVENWLFIYGFYKKKYQHIPESFIDFELYDDNADRKRSKKTKNERKRPPIVELITNLNGRQQRKFLIQSNLKSLNDIDQLSYIFEMNTNILEYLRKSGALLPYIDVKLLLNYRQYLLYNKLKENSQHCYHYKEFYLLSKQTWLDLILQCIRIFVFESKIGRNSLEIPHDWYSWKTLKLIDWLKERCIQENPNLNENFNDFQLTRNLRDGIILTYVTISYCSYCKNFLKNLLTNPVNNEEIFHNCCNLMEMWKLLRFNIDFDPFRLYRSQLFEILLLVNYLYETLPNCVPQQTLIIDAPLSQSGSIDLDVNNPYRFQIVYDINLIDNNQEMYEIKERSIRIPAKKSVKLKIKYLAKFIEKSTCILLLTNDNYKSLVYNLIGHPDLNQSTNVFNLKLQLYEIKEFDLLLQSPYRINCSYKSMFTYKPGGELQDFNTNTSILFQHPDEIVFDETGQCLIKMQICCYEKDERPIWVYNLNPDIGDWCVKFVLDVEFSNDKFRTIEINLPKQYDNYQCTCQKDPDLNNILCPKRIKIPIPARNFYLWEIRKELLLQKISAEDYELWKYRLNTPSGARIIELLILSSLKSMDVSQEFNVVIANKPPFIFKDTLKIHDVLIDDSVDFAIHPIKNLNGTKLYMSLTSMDGKELRYYQINFVVLSI